MACDDLLHNLADLVRKHQAGLLLDTNVLLHYVAMVTDKASAVEWTRSTAFGESHFLALEVATRAARRLVTTPHVLTEATDLADRGMPDHLQDRFRETLRQFALATEERQVKARVVAGDPVFKRLGLADLAQAFHRKRSRPLVLTIDFPLYIELANRELPVANLNHFAFST
jgi:predicted nucleic acid-binding protein